MNKQQIKDDITIYLGNFNNYQPPFVVRTENESTQIVGFIDILINNLQQYIPQLSAGNLVIYNYLISSIEYIREFVSSNVAILFEESTSGILNINLWKQFNDGVAFCYNNGFVELSNELLTSYNPKNHIYYIWKQINETIRLFYLNTDTLQFTVSNFTIVHLNIVISNIQKIVATYKVICNIIDNMWSYISNTLSVNTSVPTFFILPDSIYTFGVLIGTGNRTTSIVEQTLSGLCSGLIYTKSEVEVPHLGTLILNTFTEQTIFEKNSDGFYVISLNSTENIEENQYIIVGNKYVEYKYNNTTQSISNNFCDYGRVVFVDKPNNLVLVEGTFHSTSYNTPSVVVFSMPNEKSYLPSNVSSISYTTIYKTDWGCNQLICGDILNKTPLQICTIYTLIPTYYTVYNQSSIRFGDSQYTMLYINVDKVDYSYPRNSFIVIYETDITKLLINSNLCYNQLLLTSRLSAGVNFGDTLISLTNRLYADTVVDDCLIAIPSSNGIYYFPIDSVINATATIKTSLPTNFETGTLVHIIYFYSFNQHLPPFTNNQYKNKTLPVGCNLVLVTTLKQKISTKDRCLLIENSELITPGCYVSIDNGELNEYSSCVVSVDTLTNTVTLAAPPLFLHETGCVLQFYSFSVKVPNLQYLVGLKTIKWDYTQCHINNDYDESPLFPGISTRGSVSILMYDVSSISKNMVGVLGTSEGTTEYIQVIDVDNRCGILYINKPLKFNYPEYYGIQFFSLTRVIQQSGVSLQHIVFNILPTSVGDSVLHINNQMPYITPGQILSIDSYGDSEITTVNSIDLVSNSVQVIPPLNYSHPSYSTIVTYDYVFPFCPAGSAKIDQLKISKVIMPGTNTLWVNNANDVHLGAYIVIGYNGYEDSEFKIMEIDKHTNTLIVDNLFTKYYYTNTLCQFYIYPKITHPSATQSATYLLHTYTNVSIRKGTTELVLENMDGITIGSLLQIGTTTLEYKTVDDYYGNTVVVDTPFYNNFYGNTLVILYAIEVPPVPKDCKLLTTTFAKNVAMAGETTIQLNNGNLCIPNETYLLIGYGAFVETFLIISVAQIDNTQISIIEVVVDKPLQNTYNAGCIAQIFKYKDIPGGATLKLRKTINYEIEYGSRIIAVDTSTLPSSCITTNPLFLQIGSENSSETNLSIVQMSTNTVELTNPLLYTHPVGSTISFYLYSALPENTALISLMTLTRPIQRGTNEIFVDNIKGIKVGMNYYLQVGNGPTIDTGIKVVSVNITENSIMVSTPFTHSHTKNTTIQLYVGGLPELTVPFTNTNAVILEKSVECGSVVLAVSSKNGISVGMYGLIDTGSLTERFVVMDVTQNKVYLNLNLLYSHKEGSVIQFFSVPHPDQTKLVDYKEVYKLIKSFKDSVGVGAGVVQDTYDCDSLYSELLQWNENESNTHNADIVSLISPLLELTGSRCLTFTTDETTKNISAYVPFYKTVKKYYGELENISQYNPIPKVNALLFLVKDIIQNILPIVDKFGMLISKIQMIYSIYYQLYISQKMLESYLASVNIEILPEMPHLNYTDFLVLLSIDLSFGCLIGGAPNGAGVINEPGTIYAKPYVRQNELIVNEVCRQTCYTNPGDSTISINFREGVSSMLSLDSILYIDIGIAQEKRGIKQITGTTIILEKELTFPHKQNTMIFVCSKSKPINFVLNEFTTEFRLIQNIEITAEVYDVPTSTFIAHGTISKELFINTFLFGTTEIDEFIMDFSSKKCNSYKNTKRLTMGFYVDSSNWNDVDNYSPKLEFSKLKCSNGYYSTTTYLNQNEPDLSVIQTSTLIYNIFNVANGVGLVSNLTAVSNSMSYNFSKYIWNNVYGAILWTQDYRRKPLETIITETQTKKTVNISNENLVKDSLNNEMSFIPLKENTGSIAHKLFSQLTGGDITRLQNAKLYRDYKHIYHFPFIEGDKIIFKVNVKYALNNVSSICNNSGIIQGMSELNTRFNEGKTEHSDYNSYTVVLTLV